MNDSAKLLIFTDMDGTLLDHEDYSFAAAIPLLKKLKSLDIPVIANTSKTLAEMIPLSKELQLDTPFVIENGGAVVLPESFVKHHNLDNKLKSLESIDGFYLQPLMAKKDKWIGILQKMSHSLKWLQQSSQHNDNLENHKLRSEENNQHTKSSSILFEYYSTMTVERLQEITGLNYQQASQSKQRYFTEPVIWHGNDAEKNVFVTILQNLGANILMGGRFIHVMEKGDKAAAMAWLCNLYQNIYLTKNIKTIALGDSQNDVAMLEAADIAVRILSPMKSPPELIKSKHVYTSQRFGSQGWVEMIESLLFNHPKKNDSNFNDYDFIQ